MNDLKLITAKLRRRLTEYRMYKIEDTVSIHINAIEMAVCLTEVMIDNKKTAIILSDQRWFKAGHYVTLILENSPWEDLSTMYGQLVDKMESDNAVSSL